jgi:serine/threonine-protein kinase
MHMTGIQLPAIADPAYRIEEELGAGGVGVVYKAWHDRLQKYVVLKRIRDEASGEHDRIRTEVDILKNLKHSNLPQIYDFLQDGGGVYTVMEFIPGRSLAELTADGRRVPQRDVIRWAVQLSSALRYMHGQKPPVLHSDIKPANIMLKPDGDVCLIDFNVSLVLSGESAEVKGRSHGYASPEQYGPEALPRDLQIQPESAGPTPSDGVSAETEKLRPDGVRGLADGSRVSHGRSSASASRSRRARIRMDARSDIYSLGATLYHLLTGEKPAISTVNVKPLSSFGLPIGEAMIYIVERCMARDPAKRFQSAGELHDAFVNIQKLDSRWKRRNIRKNIAAAALSAIFALSCSAAVLGGRLMGEEADAAYGELVYKIADAENDVPYESAIAMFPDRLDAYHARALKLCVPGSYDACIDYIDSIISRLSAYARSDAELRMIGDIYYVAGDSYFELEDYPNAVSSYEAAIGNNPGNPEMYRDYAIALARCAYVDRAEELLEKIQKMQIGDDSIALLRGEIAYAKQNNAEAIEWFRDVIATSNDDYMLQRAYLICDKAYRRVQSGGERENVALLRDALRVLPARYSLVITERLADALSRAGEYAEAAALFEELKSRGNISYATAQNIGVLYQRIGDFARAREAFERLAADFPDNYGAYLRMAFLLLEEQAALPNERRDYAETDRWYVRARELYGARPQSAGDDMEMLLLDSLIADLRQNGWLQEGTTWG